MATFSNIGLEEASTITNRAATVTINRGGVTEDQEILVIGGAESSLEIARVVDTTPDSSHFGLVVREAAPTTTVQVSSLGGAVVVRSSAASALHTVYQSSQAELRATIYQSTASELNVTVAGYVAPSTIQTISTGSVRVVQSTASDLNVTVSGYSTTVNVSSLGGQVLMVPVTSSGLELTTNTTPGSTAEGIITRLAPTTLTVDVLSTGSVRVTQSSAAELNVTVAGYSTTVNVSSMGGAVITRSSAANSLHTVYQSTASDLNVTVAGYVAPSTIITISTGSMTVSALDAALVSSGDPVIGQQGLLVESNPINTTYVSGTLSSAESTIVAAISTSAFCVFGLTVSVPPTSSQTVRVVAASTNEKWRIFFHSTAVSAGVVDNVTPPQYLFKTAANQSLALTSSGGTADVTYTMKYYEEG